MQSAIVEGKVERVANINSTVVITLEGLYAGYIFVGGMDSTRLDASQKLKLALTKVGDLVSLEYTKIYGPCDTELELTNFKNNNLAHYKYASDDMTSLMSETPRI